MCPSFLEKSGKALRCGGSAPEFCSVSRSCDKVCRRACQPEGTARADAQTQEGRQGSRGGPSELSNRGNLQEQRESRARYAGLLHQTVTLDREASWVAQQKDFMQGSDVTKWVSLG